MAANSLKPEFPPLLEVGLHERTVTQLRELCVNGFVDRAVRREPIMSGLDAMVKKLAEGGIIGKLWVDGSFLTQKSEPDDVDLLLHVTASFVEKCDQKVRQLLDWFRAEQQEAYACHTFMWIEFEKEDDPDYWIGEYTRAYWLKQYGFARFNAVKGIAVVKLPDGAA